MSSGSRGTPVPVSEAVVAVLGDTRTSSAIAARLRYNRTVRTTADGAGFRASVVVVASDAWADPRTHALARERARQWQVPWLSVEVMADTALLGPTAFPGRPGCDVCARTRRLLARRETEAFAALEKSYGSALCHAPAPAAATFGRPVIAELVADEVMRTLKGDEPRTDRAVLHLRLTDLAISRHAFLPLPLCPHCGELPDDSAEAAIPESRPRPKLARDVYRIRSLRDRDTALLASYVDRENGLVHQIEKTTFAAFPYASAMMSIPQLRENGYGRALDFQICITSAISEALERLGNVRPAGRRTVVQASYHELADRAVDPRSLGLYPPERYAESSYPLRPYRADEEIEWVWGYSYSQQRPVLVPESYAYHRRHHYEPKTSYFVHETSNGCAVGGCLEEAVLRGLLELVERDSFLMTWYARLPVRPLDLRTAHSPVIALMTERLEYLHGYQVHAFDNTMEHGIPSVWVMAVHPGDGPRQAKAFCASGTGFDPEDAVIDGLLELAVVMPRQIRLFSEEFDRVSAMVDRPEEVRDMEDHALLYCHPRAFDRFDFLLRDDEQYSIDESFADAFRPRGTDLVDDLDAVVDRFRAVDLDVVAVDQTTPEHLVEDFACAKVMVPGMLPLSFGHKNLRVHGLPRLLTTPHALGYRDRPLHPHEANRHPHPYP